MKKKFMIVAAAAAIFGLLTFTGCETTDPDNGDKTEQTGENGNEGGSGSDENDGPGEDGGEQGGEEQGGGETVAPDFPLDRQWVAEPEPNETEEMLGITWTKRLFDISSGNTVKLGQMNSYYAITLPLSNPDFNKDTDFVSVDEIVGIAVSGTSGTAGTISGTSDKFEDVTTIEYSNLTENSVTITYDGSVYECTAAETVMKFIEM